MNEGFTLLAQSGFDPSNLVWMPIFVFMGVWWWILFLIASCLIFWALEKENIFGSTIVFFGTLAAMTFLGGSEMVNFITTGYNWAWIIGGYLACGVVWGFIKWWVFVTDRLDKYEDVKLEWLANKGVEGKTVPPALREQWMAYLADNTDFAHWHPRYAPAEDERTVILTVKPSAARHKWRITNWMAYWPWSLIWTFFADIVKRVFSRLQRYCARMMDAISAWVFKNTDEDFAVPPQPDEDGEEEVAAGQDDAA